MRTVGYIRISTDKQDLDNQKFEILNYAHKNNITIDDFISIEVSSRKTNKERKIDELLGMLENGYTLIISELSRLGRSVGEVVNIIHELMKNKINFVSIKEKIELIDGDMDMTAKVQVTMFSLMAELERDFISIRTKEALQALKAKGVILGRPVGSGTSKLDEYATEIIALLKNGSSKTFIAKRYKTSLQNLYKWLSKNKITSD